MEELGLIQAGSEQQVSAPREGTWLIAGLKRPRLIWRKVLPVMIRCRQEDKKGLAKTIRPTWSNRAVVQGMSSCRAQEDEGSQKHPFLLNFLIQSRGARSQLLPDQMVSESLTHLLPASRFSIYTLLPGALLALLSQPSSSD